MWITGSYDPPTNQVIWGTGNPVPMFDPTYRPGDNLYTDSMISWNPDSGSMNWYFQYLPGDMWDYDEEGSHILIDGDINGQKHTLVTHSARNGFLYTFERNNGQPVLAKPRAPLSPSELAVLRLLPSFLTNQEIADALFLSVNTVKTHLRSIYRKLAATSRRDAIASGRRLRLL